jgi:hypothetical protein
MRWERSRTGGYVAPAVRLFAPNCVGEICRGDQALAARVRRAFAGAALGARLGAGDSAGAVATGGVGSAATALVLLRRLAAGAAFFRGVDALVAGRVVALGAGGASAAAVLTAPGFARAARVWSSTTTSPNRPRRARRVAPLARGSENTEEPNSSFPLAPRSEIRLPPFDSVTTIFAGNRHSSRGYRVDHGVCRPPSIERIRAKLCEV